VSKVLVILADVPMFRFFVLMSVIIGQASTGHAAVYKWVDEQGVTQFTETPPPRGGKAVEVPMDTGGKGVAGRNDAPIRTWQEQEQNYRKQFSEQNAAEEAQRQQKAAEQQQQEEKYRQCTQLRKRIIILETPRPVYDVNEKGERIYMDDNQRASELAAVKRSFQSQCGS